MDSKLAIKTNNESVLLPASAGKDTKSRLNRFVQFLDSNGQAWYNPDLAAYRDDLLQSLKPSSVKVHLATIRGRYKVILADNATRDNLFAVASQVTDNVLERKAFVDETLTRLSNAVNPLHSRVKVEKKQDVTDSEQLRLTVGQAETLLKLPGTDNLKGLRDTAIVAFAIATGLRESELANLEVKDLRQTVDGILGVYVKEGKGCKSRFVPYGNFEQVLTLIDRWLQLAGIEQGKVFRGFYHHSRTVTDSITPRAIQNVLKSYPVMVKGISRTVKPHDLRRTYARLLYDAKMDIVSISKNLGHSSIETTLKYIGNTKMGERMPNVTINFNL